MQSEPTNKQLLDAILETQASNTRLEAKNEELMETVLQTQEALHLFATDVDHRFDEVNSRLGGMEQRIGGMEQRIGGMEQRIGGMEQRLSGVEGRVGGMEQRMVTKDYLDDKLADQGACLSGLIRETNGVIGSLTDVIVTAGSLPRPVGERIKRQRPFFRAAK